MTGEVEVVAWRVRPRGDAVWHLTDDPRPNTGYEREPLVPASALEALRADNERLKAAIFGGTNYDRTLKIGNFVEMARSTEAGRLGAIARAERAEASLAGRDAEIAKAVAEKPGAIGYMCLTDFEDELGAASGGNRVHPSIADLREFRKCVDECGIAEVEVRLRSITQPARAQEPRS